MTQELQSMQKELLCASQQLLLIKQNKETVTVTSASVPDYIIRNDLIVFMCNKSANTTVFKAFKASYTVIIPLFACKIQETIQLQ